MQRKDPRWSSGVALSFIVSFVLVLSIDHHPSCLPSHAAFSPPRVVRSFWSAAAGPLDLPHAYTPATFGRVRIPMMHISCSAVKEAGVFLAEGFCRGLADARASPCSMQVRSSRRSGSSFWGEWRADDEREESVHRHSQAIDLTKGQLFLKALDSSGSFCWWGGTVFSWLLKGLQLSCDSDEQGQIRAVKLTTN